MLGPDHVSNIDGYGWGIERLLQSICHTNPIRLKTSIPLQWCYHDHCRVFFIWFNGLLRGSLQQVPLIASPLVVIVWCNLPQLSWLPIITFYSLSSGLNSCATHIDFQIINYLMSIRSLISLRWWGHIFFVYYCNCFHGNHCIYSAQLSSKKGKDNSILCLSCEFLRRYTSFFWSLDAHTSIFCRFITL